MMATGGAIDDGVRRHLAEDPAGVAAVSDVIRAVADGPTVFRWFRRLATLTVTPDGDVLRKAIEATRTVDGASLARFAHSGVFTDRLIVPFVAAALLVNKRLDFAKIAATPYQFATMRGNFDKAISLLSEQTIPSSARDIFEIMLVKQHIGATLLGAGYPDLAAAVYRNASVFIRNTRRTLYGSEARGFTDQWTVAIGHMVLLAFLIKGQDAGILDFSGANVWDAPVANRYLWQRVRALSDKVRVVPQTSTFADNHSSRNLEWIDDRFVDCFEACGIIADRAGDPTGGILERPARSNPVLARFFEAAGIDPRSRIVTLHFREPGFRTGRRHDLRNADVQACLPALSALAAQGYQVIRLGDPSMTALPVAAGVFDYARSPFKSAELDVLLPAAAAFHIGSSSGLSLVPLLFGTPSLFLNWHPFDLLPWGRRNWTVVKSIAALADGRRVTDRERYAHLGQMRDRRLLNSFGYDAHEADAVEIERAVTAFAGTLEGTGVPPATGPNIGRVLVFDDDRQLRDLV